MPDDFHIESVLDWSAEASVDDSTGVVSNVLLCGNRSKNGYAIPERAFGGESNAIKLYDRKPVFVNHGEYDPRNRRVEDIGGYVTNVKMKGGRPFGDIVTANAPQGEMIQKMAKAKIPGVGMSHVARYEFNMDRTLVESIREVSSVDLVAFPATTKAFSESQKKGDSEMAEANAVEILTKQIADQKAAYESQVKSLGEQVSALTKDLESAVAKVAESDKARSDLAKTVADFESQNALASRRNWISDKLREHKLNADDKVVCSESWVKSLMTEPDDATREGLIKDRKEMLESAAAGKLPVGKVTQERGSGTEKTAVNFESISKGIGVPLFTS